MQILLALPDDIKNMLKEDDIYAPYLVNHQVNFRVQGHNDIPFIQRSIQLYIKTNGVKVKGRDIYCIQEPSPEARDKNRIVAKATSTLEEHLPDLGPEHHHHMRVDMRAGVCYYQPIVDRDAGLVNIGNIKKKTTWQWHDEALPKAWPELDVEALRQATALVLEERRGPDPFGSIHRYSPKQSACLVSCNVDKTNSCEFASSTLPYLSEI